MFFVYIAAFRQLGCMISLRITNANTQHFRIANAEGRRSLCSHNALALFYLNAKTLRHKDAKILLLNSNLR